MKKIVVILVLVLSPFAMGLYAQCDSVKDITVNGGGNPVLSNDRDNLLKERFSPNLLDVMQSNSNVMGHFQGFYKSIPCYDGMRYFNSMEELFNEIDKLGSMEEEELASYEDSIGFMSFGRKSETIYWQILKELGEPFGVEYFGDEEMDTIDVEFTTEDALVYVSQYPQYLEVLMSTISEEGYDDYDIDEFIPKYYLNRFRYVMNEDRMFQVEGRIYKVFTDYVIWASISNINVLFDVTEANIDDFVTGLDDDEEEGGSGGMMYGTKPPTDNEIGTNTSERYNPFPGCSGRTKGTLGRKGITDVRSFYTSGDKTYVVANFYCLTGWYEINVGTWYKPNYVPSGDYWYCNAFYNLRAWWRGCKNCDTWVMCRRTLNASFCTEIWADQTVYNIPETTYKSSKPERKSDDKLSIFLQNFKFLFYSNGDRVPIEISSLFNITGTVWIATASRTFAFGEDVPIRTGGRR